MDFRFTKDSGLNQEKALSLEWLETNSLGGYASSTILNCNTRKYHGLLVSKLENLPDKYVLLSKIEDAIEINDQKYFLSAHQYPNYFQDGSFSNFQEYQQKLNPQFIFKFGEIVIAKEIILLHGENTVLIKYQLLHGNRAKLSIRPFIAQRNFHQLAKENPAFQKETKLIKNGFAITPYKTLPTLYLQLNTNFNLEENLVWYKDFVYSRDQERGYDSHEDLFAADMFKFDLVKEKAIIFSCSLSEKKHDLCVLWDIEIKRRQKFYDKQTGCDFQIALKKVALSFIEHSKSFEELKIIAGFHWFLEWGRDAMIALPGLTLFSGMKAECLAILKTFAKNEKQGLIPNYLGTTIEQNSYNSIDASLWFIWASQQFFLKTKDANSIKMHLWSTIKNIFYGYNKGTLFDIKMQENGLIYAANKDVNLTWMDACVAGKPVTPRSGFQVEVNALWYNALCFMLELAKIFHDEIEQELLQLIPLVKKSFGEIFWNPSCNYLNDFVNTDEINCQIRPNQIFAVSLPNSPMSNEQAKKIVEVVKNNLLTPVGLRTLAANDRKYCGNYAGIMADRDRAYHNGTVWPWLLGHFGEAFIKVTSVNKAQEVLVPTLHALQNHLSEYGIGTIAEIFSGDFPHAPNGCISQAWSVAEVLRLTYLLNWSEL